MPARSRVSSIWPRSGATSSGPFLRATFSSWSATHWNHALLLKHLGRFDEALAALAAYRSAGGEGDKAFNWNTGICATGAGLGQKALDAWLAENFKIALGVDGMPEGGFPDVQVRISSRGPLGGPPCEPAPDAPGYEYGWVRPRSPCHGVLLTPLVMDDPAVAVSEMPQVRRTRLTRA